MKKTKKQKKTVEKAERRIERGTEMKDGWKD